jgi:hypothetical protein
MVKKPYDCRSVTRGNIKSASAAVNIAVDSVTPLKHGADLTSKNQQNSCSERMYLYKNARQLGQDTVS